MTVYLDFGGYEPKPYLLGAAIRLRLVLSGGPDATWCRLFNELAHERQVPAEALDSIILLTLPAQKPDVARVLDEVCGLVEAVESSHSTEQAQLGQAEDAVASWWLEQQHRRRPLHGM